MLYLRDVAKSALENSLKIEESLFVQNMPPCHLLLANSFRNPSRNSTRLDFDSSSTNLPKTSGNARKRERCYLAAPLLTSSSPLWREKRERRRERIATVEDAIIDQGRGKVK